MFQVASDTKITTMIKTASAVSFMENFLTLLKLDEDITWPQKAYIFMNTTKKKCHNSEESSVVRLQQSSSSSMEIEGNTIKVEIITTPENDIILTPSVTDAKHDNQKKNHENLKSPDIELDSPLTKVSSKPPIEIQTKEKPHIQYLGTFKKPIPPTPLENDPRTEIKRKRTTINTPLLDPPSTQSTPLKLTIDSGTDNNQGKFDNKVYRNSPPPKVHVSYFPVLQTTDGFRTLDRSIAQKSNLSIIDPNHPEHHHYFPHSPWLSQRTLERAHQNGWRMEGQEMIKSNPSHLLMSTVIVNKNSGR